MHLPYRKTEWSYISPSRGYSASLYVLGNHILVLQPSGHADVDDARNVFTLTQQVVNEHFTDGRPVISIEDYAHLKGASFEARKLYINNHKRYNRYLCKILCNTSILFQLTVEIAKRINVFPFKVHLTSTLGKAVELATVALAEIGIQDPDSGGGTTLQPIPEISHSLPDTIAHVNWSIHDDDVTLSFEVIDQRILHMIASGTLREHHIDLLMDLHRQIESTLSPKKGFDYLVADVSGLKRVEAKARKRYMKAILRLYDLAPIQAYILYGANPLVQAICHLSKPFMPFKIRLAKDLRSALESTRAANSLGGRPGSIVEEEKTPSAAPLPIQSYVEDLLQYLGKINWERNGFDSRIHVPHDHPFRPVFDVLQMIKEEIDELFQERKRVEAQLRQSQKMEAIGTLSGGIAHDFNNILTSIIGFTELALDDAEEGTVQQGNLREVIIAADRARNLVQQILTFSRQNEPEIKPIAVKPILKEACNLLRSSLPSYIEIREHIESEDLITGDATQIHQVIMNLGTNAGHAMEEQGGVLTIALRKILLDAAVTSRYGDIPSGKYIQLTVSDTGHGMRPDILERIFDPFFTTKSHGKGTGMGLSLVHGIVTGHGGIILVDSHEGRGTCFTIYLPIIEATLAEKSNPPLPIPTGNERILIVDDEYQIVKMATQMLESMGYRVEQRTASIEALELFKARPDAFDLVITDLTMPNMTGDALAKQIKRIRPNIPVILCTGFAQKTGDRNTNGLHVEAVVMKPLAKREIAETIRRVLDRNGHSI